MIALGYLIVAYTSRELVCTHSFSAATLPIDKPAKRDLIAIHRAWFKAIREGDIPTFKHLQSTYNIDPNIKNEADIYALHYAVLCRQLFMVKELIAAGALPEQRDGAGQTTLHLAVRYNMLDIVDYLIEKKVALNLFNKAQQTALHLAIWLGYRKIALALINSPACALHLPDGNLQTPLHLALLWMEDNSIAQVLIEKKVPLDVQDILGNTPLGLAALNHNLDLVRIIILHNADVNIANNDLQTPLHLVLHRPLTAKNVLLSPIDYDLFAIRQPFFPIYPPYYAQTHTFFPEEYLLYPADQYTPKNRLAIVEALHKAGATVDLQDHYGNTPLHYIAYWNNLQALACLDVKDPSCLKKKNHQQETALDIATQRGYLTMMKKLRKHY
ncbi:MAG: ankyrin repeat domain-containing protein [Bacteroidota bacterium]